MPKIELNNLVTFGTGKYPDATKTVNLNLACAPETQVNMKLEGSALTGTDNVLKNQSAGNNNVGVQLLFNGSAIKLGESLMLIHRAKALEPLVFNAYYYYKGGDVNAGIIKTSATFTLDYE